MRDIIALRHIDVLTVTSALSVEYTELIILKIRFVVGSLHPSRE